MCLAAVYFALVVSRRPDALFHPQFWAEDGSYWYQDAYNFGWLTALLKSHSGYQQFIARATAAVAMMFPLRAAPLVFNLVAIGVQILPALFIFTSRFDGLIPRPTTRLLLALAYLALPNTSEIDANLTCAQWHLGLLACMVIVARPSQRWLWKTFDVGILALAGLSGPFCIFLVPCALLAWYCTRQSWSLALLAVDVVCSGVQGVSLLSNMMSSRVHAPLGVTAVAFARILGGQVFLSAIIGSTGYLDVYRQPWWNAGSAGPILLSIACVMVMAYVVWKSNLPLRLFILFCFSTLLGSMASPLVSMSGHQWRIMASPGAGGRYYFLPMLAWVVSLVWLVGSKHRHRMMAVLGGGALAVMVVVGIPNDWRYPAYTDYQFPEHARQFEAASSGETVTIPINPGWTMVLHKK